MITLIVGLIIGALAKLVMPGKDPGGIFVTALLGIAGAFIAGMLGHSLGWYTIGEGPGLLASVGGSIILLGIYRFIAHPRTTW
ncbi:MAG TPA: GlsB/YeaQ/YmgE family stress response membrane protein [Kofleriaceae bacterium]|nr:GlsB/YeaQ/YmgE family stress response membrane protein [Kofleriaceae bacterium]